MFPILINSLLIHEYQHVSTQVNTNQYEPDTSQHESTRIRHECTRRTCTTDLTRINTSPIRVNTSPTPVSTSLKRVIRVNWTQHCVYSLVRIRIKGESRIMQSFQEFSFLGVNTIRSENHTLPIFYHSATILYASKQPFCMHPSHHSFSIQLKFSNHFTLKL